MKTRIYIMVGVIALAIVVTLFSVYLYFLNKVSSNTNINNINVTNLKNNVNKKANTNVNKYYNTNISANINAISNINTNISVNINTATNTNIVSNVKVNLATDLDKATYKAQENIALTVKVKSDKDVDNVVIQSIGVRGRSYDYFNQSKTIDLKAGKEQTVSLTSTLPSCSSCSGVSPGTYSITTSVSVNNQIVQTKTNSFVLQQ